jgi:hypothetical protein
MQPDNELPDLIIVDEPKLGFHPYALNVIASLFRKASHHTQVLISTQSSSFLDNFDPEDIIVVDRERQESRFSRPDPEALRAWLDDYTLGEVWEKNVIGGGPQTAPSKQIIKHFPDYEDAKPIVGPQVAERIGLDVIRGKCRHFASWLCRLETLGK